MEELDLKEIFNLFWNKKLQMILIIAIFIVIGVTYTMGFVTPTYTSSTTLVLAKAEDKNGTTSGDTTITATDLSLNSKLVSTYSELVKSKKVLREVISNLGLKISEDKLRSNITVSSVKNTELIEIKITNENPDTAAKLANEIAKAFIENVKDIYNLNNVHIVDQAEVPKSPSNINHTRDVIIFMGIGLVVAIVYILLLNVLDTTVKSTEDVEKLLGIPVLASIPVYSNEVRRDKGGRRR